LLIFITLATSNPTDNCIFAKTRGSGAGNVGATGRDQFIRRATVIYGTAAALWILLSDEILPAVGDPRSIVAIAMLKGLAFVGVTTFALNQLLHRVPLPADAQLPDPNSASRPIRHYSQRHLMLMASVSLALAALAVLAYQAQTGVLQATALDELRAVAEQKATSIERWSNERRTDARDIVANPLFLDVFERWRKTGGDADRRLLIDYLGRTCDIHQIDGIAIIGSDGTPLLSEGPIASEADDTQSAADAVASGRVVVGNLRRSSGNAELSLRITAPVPSMGPDPPSAVAILRLRPSAPMAAALAGWPTAATTGRAYLSERGATAALFTEPAAKGADGDPASRALPAFLQAGAEAGLARDARGTGVLAATHPVPETPWIVTATIDQEETLFSSRLLATRIGILAAGLLGIGLAIAGMLREHTLRQVAQTELAQRRTVEAADAARRRSDERLRLALLASRDGIWERDLDTGTSYHSPSWERMLGYGEGELPMRHESFAALVHPDDLSRMEGFLDRLEHAPDRRGEQELRIRHKDGHYVSVLARAQLVVNERGRPVRIVGTTLDLTERHLAEDRERRAAAIFAHSLEGIVLTGPGGDIQMINPAFVRITGYEESELVGNNMRILRSGRHDRAFYESLWASLGASGQWQGEIWNRRKSGEIYPEWLTITAVRDTAGRVVNYIGMFSDISSAKRSESLLDFLAHHDPLTQLPNRLMLQSRLEGALARSRRNHRKGAVMYLDLDRFKDVNDSLGHPAGDELLVMVAHRLRGRLRDADTLARLGGDEFVVLLEDLEEGVDAAPIAQDLIDRLRAPFRIAGRNEVYIGATVGISVFPEHGMNSDALLQHADAALYRAKATQRGTLQFYSADLTEAAANRLELEAELHRAIENHELVVYYQPIVALADRRFTGVEALVRWQHPTRGLLAPGLFIGTAEESGLIHAIGEIVLRIACQQGRAWLDAGVALETLAVNLSSHQFQSPDLVARIGRILSESGFPPQMLELELTESLLMDASGESKLAALRALGVRLAIDDFGTGYSSLAYLRRFPVDKLKIDQSFVREIPAQASGSEIAATVVAIGKALGFEVLAEGIETEAQLEVLARLGCDTGQGYLFARPLPGDSVVPLFARGTCFGETYPPAETRA
jgi:diguanylate cyclase (GGDEF)-like protein/PAS domain S-box-containing protein